MGTFQHHPDGRIYIEGTRIELAEFLIEEPDYKLPADPPGIIGRKYNGTQHVLTDGKNQRAGPVPWPEGEGYISNLATYLANISARQTTTIPTPTRDQLINSDPDFPGRLDFLRAMVAKHRGNDAPMAALAADLDALLTKYP